MPKSRLVNPGRLLLLSLVILTPPAEAGFFGAGNVVFDPSNFAKNAITAQESIQSAMQQVQSYLLQLQQYQSQLQQLQQLPQNVSGSLLHKTDQQVNNLADYQGLLNQLYGTVGQAGQLANERYREEALSGLTPQQYFQQQEQTAQVTTNGMLPAFQDEMDTMNQMDEEYQQVQAYQKEIPQVQGITASMEVMNSQLNLMIQQNADLKKLLALQGINQDNQDMTRQAQSAGETQLASQLGQQGEKERQASNEDAQAISQARDQFLQPWPASD